MRGWVFRITGNFSDSASRIIKICPKTLNLLQEQEINRDFLDFAGTFRI